jgi:hypothetical protein
MSIYRAVVVTTLLAIAHGKRARRQEVRIAGMPCEDLIATGNRFKFNTAEGHTTVCAAAKIADSTGSEQCHVRSTRCVHIPQAEMSQ